MKSLFAKIADLGLNLQLFANGQLVKPRNEDTGYLGRLVPRSDITISGSIAPHAKGKVLPVQQIFNKEDGLLYYHRLEWAEEDQLVTTSFRIGKGGWAKWPFNQTQYLVRTSESTFILIQTSVTFRKLARNGNNLVFDQNTDPKAYFRCQILFEGEAHRDPNGKLIVLGDNWHVRDSLYGSQQNGWQNIIEELFLDCNLPSTDLTREQQAEQFQAERDLQDQMESIEDTTPGVGTVLWSIHSLGSAQVVMNDGRRIKLHFSKAVVDKDDFWAPNPGDRIQLTNITDQTKHTAGRRIGCVRLEALNFETVG